MFSKPDDIFDRDSEWADLAEFATSGAPGMRIAIVYGRRRQGKSYLLRRLADAAGGLYHLATEQTETVSVRRFGVSLAEWLDMPIAAVPFDEWEGALRTAVGLASNRAGDEPTVIIIDEFPYLSHETPGLPSIIQGLYDEFGPGGTSPARIRLVLCGSAMSVMSDLLSGTRALRGRGALELLVKPFSYREARAYWGIEDTAVAFVHNALIGGTPGYRDLAPSPEVPDQPDRIGHWVARNVLRPTVPLFSEADRVVHEDPRIRDAAVYGSLMAVIANGESSPTKIGGLLGRPSASLTYQLRMLESAGFIVRHRDLLRERRPVLTVADPVVRLHHLVIEPHLAELEAGRATDVWARVQHTVDSKILGPHLEWLVTEWILRYARDEAGIDAGVAGPATIACRDHRTSHEIDVLAFEPGASRTSAAPVCMIGEAKSRNRQPGLAELERLEHLRDLLAAAGHDVSRATLAVVSRQGFSRALSSSADGDPWALLLGLDHLYGESHVVPVEASSR